MVRNLIRNQAPGNRLRVRIPCPPLQIYAFSWSWSSPFLGCALRPTRIRLQPIQRTFHSAGPQSTDVRVDHRRRHIGMAKQCLDRADVLARLEQVCCKAMPKGVAGDFLMDSSP